MKMIKKEFLLENPNNPRKDLGDLSELTESIKAHGVMQNLTVVETENGMYRLLIGHRRFNAGVLAGLDEFPCNVMKNLTESEEIGIMLSENLQRSDLTIKEQADSFKQLTLLGLSEEDIARKTGFSKKTVKSRLEISKLDGEILKEKTSTFQLNLTDLSELSKIKDVDTRNEILSKSINSNDLKNRIIIRINNEKKAEIIEKIRTKLLSLGLKEEDSIRRWEDRDIWDYISTTGITTETDPDEFQIPEGEDVSEMVFCVSSSEYYSSILFYKPAIPEVEKEETEEEKAERERSEALGKLAEAENAMAKERRAFIASLIKNPVSSPRKKEEVISDLLKLGFEKSIYLNETAMSSIYEKNFYALKEKEKEKYSKEFQKLDELLKLIVCLAYKPWNVIDRYSEEPYNKEKAEMQTRFVEILEEYGFSYSKEDYYRLLEGTHPLFETVKE